MPVITLTTDLGRSHYAAAMKGTILRINPRARIVDVSHDIGRHDVAEGAFALLSAARHFHKAIHVGVVDPEVGGSREAILFSTRNGLFLGPDNGLLVPAASASGIRSAYRIENESLMADSIHPTFHGRDVFAPVAAHLSRGARITSVGTKTREWVDLGLDERVEGEDQITAKILHVDRFGNLILSIPAEAVKGRILPANTYPVTTGTWSGLVPHVVAYVDADVDRMVLLESSSGFLELAVRQGSAAELTGASRGDKVQILLT